MAVRIRLRRMGAKKRPFFRVVVADQRSPRDGRFIEIIGKYHPLADPSVIEIDEEKALTWLRKGAQPSEAVTALLSKVGIWETFRSEKGESPTPAKASAKAPAKTKAEAETAAKAPAKTKAEAETAAKAPEKSETAAS